MQRRRAGLGCLQRRSCLGQAPKVHQADATRLLPDGRGHALPARGQRLAQQRVPALQPQQRQQRQAAVVLAPHRVAFGALGRATRRVQRGVATPLHQGCVPQEVRVVAAPVLADRKALRLLGRVQSVLGRQRALVAGGRIGVAAHADVDVGRHVHQVRRAWGQRGQAVGRGHGAGGVRGRVRGVDQVVVQADVLGLRLEQGFEPVDHLGDARQRLAGGLVVPVVLDRDHRRLGPQREDVGIIRIGRRRARAGARRRRCPAGRRPCWRAQRRTHRFPTV